MFTFEAKIPCSPRFQIFKRMKRKVIIFLLIPFVALLLQDCAQPGSLTGGGKDTIPPVMQKSYPALQQRNVSPKKIVITFDEYLSFDNIQSKFLSSPPLLEKPKIDMKGKSVVIKLKEDLRDSITYTFTFQDAVRDFHENNPINDLRFTFSTGPEIDSLATSGRLFDAFSHAPVKDALVMLYDIHTDSVPYTSAPLYVARTDSTGRFTVDFIRDGKYKVFAITDIDMNYKFSLPNEKIAFLDTLIRTSTKQIVNADTIKAGTTMFQIYENDTLNMGKLKNDSIIRHYKTEYYPDNVNLFLFEEDSKKQFIETTIRDLHGKLKLGYARKPENTDVKALNFDLEKALIERSDTGRFVTYWLPNSADIQKDTLSLLVSYPNLDSLQNLVTETDTIHFVYTFPKDTITAKRLNIKFAAKDLDHTKPYLLEFDAPIDSFNLEKFVLSEVIDTMVFDAKKQTMLYSARPQNDVLIFSFKRPLVKDLSLKFLDTIVSVSDFKLTHSAKRDTVVCEILNKNLASRHKLNIRLDYDNDFYLKQIQKFKDTVHLEVAGQAVLNAQRICPDTLAFTFNSPLRNRPKLEIETLQSADYQEFYKANSTTFKIALKTPKAINSDTLLVKLNTSEGDSADVRDRKFSYKNRLIYTPQPQGILKAERTSADKFYINFKNPYFTNLKLEAVSPSATDKWFTQNATQRKDSLSVTILNATLKAEKTVKILVSYTYRDSRLKDKTQTDTLVLTRKEPSGRKPSGVKSDGKISVKVEVPVKYELKQNTDGMIRHYTLNYAWKPGLTYKISADSLAFTDIFGRTNTELESRFTVRPKDAYGTLKLRVSGSAFMASDNYFAPADFKYDSVNYSKLTSGQIIVQLLGDKEIIVQEQVVKSDSELEFNNVLPGKYSLKFIYDKNTDNAWNTGKYIDAQQPERVLVLPEPVEISAKIETILRTKLLFYEHYKK